MELKYKHDPNKVLQSLAEILKIKMGFNPNQVLRYFYKIYPVDGLGLEHLLGDNVPPAEYENWYQIKDGASHELFFNYETREFILLYPETYWIESKITHFKYNDKTVAKKEQQYIEEMETIIETRAFQKIKPVIKWYFEKPIHFVSVVAPSPIDFINKLLKEKGSSEWLSIDENQDIEELTHDLFEAYHYEERKNKSI